VTEIPLTPRLAARLAELFASEDAARAEEWLVAECGPNFPGGFTNPAWVERVRAAALKLSDGSLDKLARVTAIGRRDWRDLLMAAGFGGLTAHEDWLDAPAPGESDA
jgi:hypothetical protein